MALITLETLIDRAKSRADQVGSDFNSEQDWKDFINEGLGDLYDLIMENYGDDYFSKTSTATLYPGSTTEISLPGDFYKLTALEYQSSTGWKSMRGFQFGERNLFTERGASFTARFVYVPELTPLSNLSDAFNFKSSWDYYVVLKAAIKARDKEEGDVSVLAAELAAKEASIIKAAPKRDLSTPRRVVDVEAIGNYWCESAPVYCIQGDNALIRYGV